MVKTRLTSSLEKVFSDMAIMQFPALSRLSMLKGERVSFQLITTLNYENKAPDNSSKVNLTPVIGGKLAEFVTLRQVKSVPVELPVNVDVGYDEQYLRIEPGMYPDLLAPLDYDGKIVVKRNMLSAVWVDITLPRDTELSGEYELTLELTSNHGEVIIEKLTVDVIPAVLPEQTMYMTQWFHCDCLASYYNVPVWSEEHWRIVENFARVAVKNGINLLLTPVFTPPLDTAPSGERLTNQLIGVTVKNGKYEFDFTLLDRWVDMCDRVGVKYFEISHLFTQWGAQHAPKVMATVDGEYKRIFGWETDATSDEYVTFLRTFLTAFIAHMKKNGNDKRCFYHISDEPQIQHLESYKAAKGAVEDLLDGYMIMDALSDYDFFEAGIVSTPIPVNTSIAPFIENNVKDLWTYYCCGQCIKVSNRLVAMPSWRNRSIGMQMFKFDIVGFLQWGYNFYNSFHSVSYVNPYLDLSGGHWVPAGDTFSVYPGTGGEALESLRIVVFHDALEDVSAMKLCASLYSKEEVVCAIESILGDTLTFDRCAYSAADMLAIREKINAMIKAKLS